ncbi:MAG TPA: hypothetical protein PKH24_20230, partial [Sedimentisphaerales bacterium]|nr:hypothetical protein [Sedimentisphaerales bacterium]
TVSPHIRAAKMGSPDAHKPVTTALAAPAPSNDFLGEFERMDPVQRQLFLDELADRPELWSGEEVFVL